MQSKYKYLTQLADTAQIQSHRLQETVGKAPELEIEMALCNVALDLLGQCRYLYQLIGKETNQEEDEVAMGRDERDMKNLLIAELSNGDFAQTIAKNFYLSRFTHLIYSGLTQSTDISVKSIAEKSLKELNYHVEYFDQWVIRLGDGTDISHKKMQEAIDYLWEYTGEFFVPVEYELDLDRAEFPIDFKSIQKDWMLAISQTLSQATLDTPQGDWAQEGGKKGVHTEHMGYILSEIRYMQLSYPDMKW